MSSAEAGTIQRQHFLDWDYVTTVWTTMTTLDQARAEWDRVGPAWEAWSEQHGEQLTEETLARIAQEPNADLIRQGHDLALAYEKWRAIYRSWLDGLDAVRWNENSGTIRCMAIQTLNIFTGECNDLPDWRQSDDRARDEARYERIQAAKAAETEEN